MTGQEKIQLILELKNKTKTGLTKAKNSINSTVKEIRGNLNKLSKSVDSTFKSMYKSINTYTNRSISKLNKIKKREMSAIKHLNDNKKLFSKPSYSTGYSRIKTVSPKAMGGLNKGISKLGGAMKFLGGPIAAGIGVAIDGIKKVVAIANEAIDKALIFNENYRKLDVLNSDKSPKERKRLRRLVHNTAYDNGFDLNKTTDAFHSVQTITKKFGGEAEKIVSKQGKFANLLQADFNLWIEGTAKAMETYGFGADKLDDFNKAAYATVSSGAATYDELGQYMQEYLKSASDANQEFSATNKMFTLFKSNVNSIDEASSLTNSLFQDLASNDAKEAFKQIGIDIYDSNDKIKQADILLLELNEKYKELGGDNDAINILKNHFVGSEGLTAFIQLAMDKTDQLKRKIEDFQKAESNLPKALDIALKDPSYRLKEMKNQLETEKKKLGEALIPIKLGWTNAKLFAVDTFKKAFMPETVKQEEIQKGRDNVVKEFDNITSNPIRHTRKEFEDALIKIKTFKEEFKEKDEGITLFQKAISDKKLRESQRIKGSLEALDQLELEIQNFKDNLPENHDINLLKEREKELNNETEDNNEQVEGSIIQPKIPDNLNIDKITNSAQPAKSINISIDSFVKGGINTENTTLQHMNSEQLEEWFSNMFMRVVRNVELVY